jgi:hypothetical protein
MGESDAALPADKVLALNSHLIHPMELNWGGEGGGEARTSPKQGITAGKMSEFCETRKFQRDGLRRSLHFQHSFLELQATIFKTLVQISLANGRFENVRRMESIGRCMETTSVYII